MCNKKEYFSLFSIDWVAQKYTFPKMVILLTWKNGTVQRKLPCMQYHVSKLDTIYSHFTRNLFVNSTLTHNVSFTPNNIGLGFHNFSKVSGHKCVQNENKRTIQLDISGSFVTRWHESNGRHESLTIAIHWQEGIAFCQIKKNMKKKQWNVDVS